MKKSNAANKLTLKTETVKALTERMLGAVIGGAQPTTTVLHTKGVC